MTLSIQKASPRLTTSADPIPNVVDEVRIKFKAVPQDAPDRKERCWQVVVAQACGLDVLKAAAIFLEIYSPPHEPICIRCLDEVDVKLPFELFEALKKDSGTLRGMADDAGTQGLYVNIESQKFSQILALLYPEYYQAYVRIDAVEQITIANYLDIPSLLNRVLKQLKRRIRNFDENDYEEAFMLYKQVLSSPLKAQPFFEDLTQVEVAEYFGLYLQRPGKENTNIEFYVALTFENPVAYSFIERFSESKNLKHLFIHKGTHLSSWPSGFNALETLILYGFPIKNVAFPANLKSLTVHYIEPLVSDLLPMPQPADLRGYPLNLESLELSYHCRAIELAHVPKSLNKLTLSGDIYLNDEHKLPTELIRFECDQYIRNRSTAFPTSLRALIVNSNALSFSMNYPLKDLQRLDLRELKIYELIPAFAQITTALRVLDVAFIDSSQASLSKLPPLLESLTAPIHGLGLSYLPYLRRLHLSYSIVTDEELKHLRSDLKELVLHSVTITDRGLANLPKGLTSLALINLDSVTNQGIAEIPRKITQLNLSYLKITTGCFVFLPRCLESLIVLGVMLDTQNYEHLPHTLEKFTTDNADVKKINGAKVYKI